MRIDININGLDTTSTRTRSAKKSTWEKLKDKYVVSLTAGSMAGVTWDAIDTTLVSDIGSMANDVTVQNQVNNTIAIANRGKNLLNAAWMGSAAGVPGIMVGVTLAAVGQVVQAYQANTDWKLQALENKMSSIVELSALGLSSSDLNR